MTTVSRTPYDGQLKLGFNEKLILDDDGDSVLYASADDVVRLELAGNEFLRFDGSGANPKIEIRDGASESGFIGADGSDVVIDSEDQTVFSRRGSTIAKTVSGAFRFVSPAQPNTDGGVDLGSGSLGWGALYMSGLINWLDSADEQTTVGSAGGASNVPSSPDKYLKVKDSAGTTLVIPAFAAS